MFHPAQLIRAPRALQPPLVQQVAALAARCGYIHGQIRPNLNPSPFPVRLADRHQLVTTPSPSPVPPLACAPAKAAPRAPAPRAVSGRWWPPLPSRPPLPSAAAARCSSPTGFTDGEASGFDTLRRSRPAHASAGRRWVGCGSHTCSACTSTRPVPRAAARRWAARRGLAPARALPAAANRPLLELRVGPPPRLVDGRVAPVEARRASPDAVEGQRALPVEGGPWVGVEAVAVDGPSRLPGVRGRQSGGPYPRALSTSTHNAPADPRARW